MPSGWKGKSVDRSRSLKSRPNPTLRLDNEREREHSWKSNGTDDSGETLLALADSMSNVGLESTSSSPIPVLVGTEGASGDRMAFHPFLLPDATSGTSYIDHDLEEKLLQASRIKHEGISTPSPPLDQIPIASSVSSTGEETENLQELKPSKFQEWAKAFCRPLLGPLTESQYQRFQEEERAKDVDQLMPAIRKEPFPTSKTNMAIRGRRVSGVAKEEQPCTTPGAPAVSKDFPLTAGLPPQNVRGQGAGDLVSRQDDSEKSEPSRTSRGRLGNSRRSRDIRGGLASASAHANPPRTT